MKFKINPSVLDYKLTVRVKADTGAAQSDIHVEQQNTIKIQLHKMTLFSLEYDFPFDYSLFSLE